MPGLRDNPHGSHVNAYVCLPKEILNACNSLCGRRHVQNMLDTSNLVNHN